MILNLKIYRFLIAVLGTWVLCASVAGASWFLDETRFHISAHGQTACLDCHEDVPALPLHPDPDRVDETRMDFFVPERCLTCHDGVSDDLAEGRHGSKAIVDAKKYTVCIRCHKPHTQRRLGDNPMGTFKPGVPRREQCGACHEPRKMLPPLSGEDEACMTCHRLSREDDPDGAKRVQTFCLHCHATGETPARFATGRRVPLMDPEQYGSLAHAEISCTACHPGSARFRHADQQAGDCLRCHRRHDEKVTHDAHLTVACASCHLKGVKPVRDPETRRVVWTFDGKPGEVLQVHDMALGDDETSCRRCHTSGNQVGAAAMVLPSKSVICMPCHAATFSVGDATTIGALLVFLFGVVMLVSYWMTGSVPGVESGSPVAKTARMAENVIRTVFSKRGPTIAWILFLDVLLQRRLYRRSRGRWLIHGLIFYPFVLRFVWGMTALCATRWAPGWGPAWAMIDKNHPVTGILFDITGIMVIFGIVLAFVHGVLRDHEQPESVPRRDRAALLLIGAVVIVGFFVEGVRIAMTGRPAGSGWAFAGYAVSLAFSHCPSLTSIYGPLWYAHAVLTGVLVAYLPFSRLLHIIIAPFSLALTAVSEREHRKGVVHGR